MDKEEKLAMQDQIEMVAKAFVDHYYLLFDSNRIALPSLYTNTSMLSFEGEKVLGVDEITRKLAQLPFDQCKHSISTIDCQPSPFAGGILVFVSGNLQLPGEEHQLKFSQEILVINEDQISSETDTNLQGGHQLNNLDLGMEDFFTQVEDIEKQMEKLYKQLDKVQDSIVQSKYVKEFSAMETIKRRMDNDVNEVRKVARSIKAKINEIDKDNLTNQQKPDCGQGTGVDRSRMTITSALKTRLKNSMTTFQNYRQSIQDVYQDFIENCFFTVTGTRPDNETIDRLVETENHGQILQQIRRGEVFGTIAEIREGHDTVTELEKNLLDLHQIFLDMAVLIEGQGDMLDNIEIQVNRASDYVHSAIDEFDTADRETSWKSKMIMVTIFLLVLLLLIQGRNITVNLVALFLFLFSTWRFQLYKLYGV